MIATRKGVKDYHEIYDGLELNYRTNHQEINVFCYYQDRFAELSQLTPHSDVGAYVKYYT